MSKQIIITREELQRLYWVERKSSIEIGQIFHCHPMTIRNRISELGIIKRSSSDARMRYEKRNFSGNLIEQAYLLGFRIGDLSVYQTNNQSDLIVVRCHTTQKVQVELIKRLFSTYGQVTISIGKYGYNINCFLNKTFSFLLPKNNDMPEEIMNLKSNAWAFLAGYIDAEGYFGINQGKARFKLDSYDVYILQWSVQFLKESNIAVKFRKIAFAGQPQYRNGTFHKDLWRLEVNDGISIRRFIEYVGMYIQHKKRKSDMIMCLDNIKNRILRGTIK